MYRILVCDDERDIVSALRIYLTAEGYEVLEAYNGSEMLRLAAMQEVHLGADDYVTKPFNPIEVMARVRSQLRRYLQLGGGQVLPTQVTIGGIMLDDAGRTVTVDGEPVALTPTEFDILRLLMQHAGTVFSPREIYRRVWGDSPVGVENAVAVHIRHLRSKIEIDPTEPRYLKVVWGKGYKMEERRNEKAAR